MIHYALKCSDGHDFESWFQSAEAFDALKAAGHLSCAICGSTQVDKAIMAPRVAPARSKADHTPPPAETPPTPAPAALPDAKTREMLQQMRKQVEDNATYVGDTFAKEARDQHLGDAPERPIYGEARPEDAKSLIEDGVPVMPLPFMPSRKTN